MAYSMFGRKPLSELMMGYWQLDPWQQFQLHLIQNKITSVQQNEFANAICKMGAILPQPQCIKPNELDCMVASESLFPLIIAHGTLFNLDFTVIHLVLIKAMLFKLPSVTPHLSASGRDGVNVKWVKSNWLEIEEPFKCLYVRETNCVIPVPADVLALIGAIC